MVQTSCRESGPVLLSSFPYGGGSQFGSRIAERGISSAWLERLHRTQEAIGSNPIFSTQGVSDLGFRSFPADL